MMQNTKNNSATADPTPAKTLVVTKCGLSLSAVDAAPRSFATNSTRSRVARIQYAKNAAKSANKTPGKMSFSAKNITDKAIIDAHLT